MLEMSGIAYVGPTPMGHAMAFDRVVARVLMQEAAVPTPAFRVMAGPGGDPGGLRYPLVIRPRREQSAKAIIVKEPEQLRPAVRKVVRRYRQEAFVEEHVAGRHITAALLGNAPVRCLPLVELDPGTRAKICPAPLDKALAKRIRACARTAFRACGCRDYARVDLRVGEAGDVWVLGVSTLGILAHGGSFVRAGREGGFSFGRLMRRIVEVARARGPSGEPLRPVRPRSPDGATADLLDPGSGSPVAGARPAADRPRSGHDADRMSGVAPVP
jgi:D-alanine-D-alanine ligase